LSEAPFCNQADTFCSGAERDSYRTGTDAVNQYKSIAKAIKLKKKKNKRQEGLKWDIWFSFVKIAMEK